MSESNKGINFHFFQSEELFIRLALAFEDSCERAFANPTLYVVEITHVLLFDNDLLLDQTRDFLLWAQTIDQLRLSKDALKASQRVLPLVLNVELFIDVSDVGYI